MATVIGGLLASLYKTAATSGDPGSG